MATVEEETKDIFQSVTFNDRYFARNVDKLFRMRNYLRQNPHFYFDCGPSISRFQKEVLELSGSFDEDSDMSLVEYVTDKGTQLARGKIYRTSPILTALCFVYLKNVLDGVQDRTNIMEMPLEKFQEYVKFLSENQPIQGKRWSPDHPDLAIILQELATTPGPTQMRRAIALVLDDLRPNPMVYWKDILARVTFNLMAGIQTQTPPYRWPKDEQL